MQVNKYIFQEWIPVMKCNTTMNESTTQTDDVTIGQNDVFGSMRSKRTPVHLLSLTIRRNILHARLKQMYTVTQLANMIGITDADIIELENGDRFPDAMIIAKLEATLGVRLTPI